MLSRRAPWDAPANRLSEACRAADERGIELLDLTESNPTRAGIEYPYEDLGAVLAATARVPYAPDPLGLRSAREALAADLSTATDPVSPDDLILTASTSEAYGFLFKLLGDPGDEIATHLPSYPLLDHLAALESLHLRRFPLHFHGARWELDPSALASALSDRTRAVVLINPNNPTGSFVNDAERADLSATLAPRQIPVIADEVFFDYPLREEPLSLASLAAASDLPVVSLGGLSKGAGLPHWKLGWIRLGGPEAWKTEARRGLELIGDSYLSVGTPVQAALPALLPLARTTRASIRRRIRLNLAALDERLRASRSVTRLPVEGGWSAVLRVPLVESEEDLAIALLEGARVLTHPGYFFDFASEGYLIVSLLTDPGVFEEGIGRLARFVEERTAVKGRDVGD